jgi:hypothetical protein
MRNNRLLRCLGREPIHVRCLTVPDCGQDGMAGGWKGNRVVLYFAAYGGTLIITATSPGAIEWRSEVNFKPCGGARETFFPYRVG